jgi:hypothetical protein
MDRITEECLAQINVIRGRHHAPLLDAMPDPLLGCPVLAALKSPAIETGTLRWGLGQTIRFWRRDRPGTYTVLHPHPAITRYADALRG